MPVSNVFEVDWIRYPGPGHQTEMCIESPLNQIGKSALAFQHANHGTYSNPGTQGGAQNKDFRAVWQKDWARILLSSVCGAGSHISKKQWQELICFDLLNMT